VINKGLIGGKWVDSKSGATIPVFSAPVVSSFCWFSLLTCSLDPATGDELGTVPEMGLEETKEAINAAGRAFTTWSKTTAKVTDLRS
jgi:succinate-semialdehyde dehydrogenase / glutarate-semialdehyde dehydrogenase